MKKPNRILILIIFNFFMILIPSLSAKVGVGVFYGIRGMSRDIVVTNMPFNSTNKDNKGWCSSYTKPQGLYFIYSEEHKDNNINTDSFGSICFEYSQTSKPFIFEIRNNANGQKLMDIHFKQTMFNVNFMYLCWTDYAVGYMFKFGIGIIWEKYEKNYIDKNRAKLIQFDDYESERHFNITLAAGPVISLGHLKIIGELNLHAVNQFFLESWKNDHNKTEKARSPDSGEFRVGVMLTL